MKQLPYDKELMKLITQLRERTGYKHVNLSNDLGIDRSTYSRMEHGDLGFTPGQLKIMAHSMKTSHYQLMALVDSKFEGDFYSSTFSTILIKALKMIEGQDEKICFSQEELRFVISVIQKKYEDMWAENPSLRFQ